MEATTAVHRALADGSRRQLVAELRAVPQGLDVRQLADRLELHQNTIRWHLGVLEDAGLVAAAPAARSGPGRRRIVYSLREESPEPGRAEYRLLATILTGMAAAEKDGAARAEAAGRSWGRYLVRRPSPLEQIGEADAIREVTTLLEEQGFAPKADGRVIGMCRCPFAELAASHPEIVCTTHKGLIDGALEELGSPLAVEKLDVFVRPDLCVARLAER